MSRRLRNYISVIVLILLAITIYRWYDRQLTPVEPPSVLPPTDIQPSPTTPGQSSVGPALPIQPPVVPTAASPDGKYPYYLGINERQYVTIYQWVNGNLLVFDQTALSTDRLRQEDIQALRGYVGVSSEEEAYQRIEALSH